VTGWVVGSLLAPRDATFDGGLDSLAPSILAFGSETEATGGLLLGSAEGAFAGVSTALTLVLTSAGSFDSVGAAGGLA